MRVSVIHLFLLATASLQLLQASPVNGQTLDDTYVTVSSAQMSLRSILLQIESETDFMIVAPSALVRHQTDLDVPTGNVSVRQLLDLIAENTSLDYRLNNKNVILFRKVEETTVEATAVRVTGRITDMQGQGLPGVNVVVQGTSVGTTTDSDGRYSLEIPDGDQTLIFSFIGFKTISAQVAGRTTIDVTLENDVAVLEEVTINGGYYKTTERQKTGSIVKVSSKDIEKQPVTSPLMALQGRVAGLEITPMTGAPGVAPTIRIRGTNSLRITGDETDGNYPLYVIDGVPVNPAPLGSFTNSYTSSGYDPLSTINPANIASIEVLKDADATAIYGSRGANGVILITTKNANAKDKTNIDFSVYSGVGNVSSKLKLLDTQQYLSMRREALRNDGLAPGQYDYDLKYWDTTRYTNWQKVLIGNPSNITDAQASISAGGSHTSFRIGLGYHKETLVFPGDFGYQRATGSVSVNHASNNNKFRLSMSANYGLDNSKLFNDAGGMVNAALTLPPFAPNPYNEDGTLNWQTVNGTLQSTWTNPMSFLLNKQKAVSKNFVTNATIGYEVLPSLTLSTNIGYTELNGDEVVTSPKSAVAPEFKVTSGTASFNASKRTSWIMEPKINYAVSIRKHEISVVTGTTLQASTSEYSTLGATQYTSDALLTSLKAAGLINSYRDDLIDYKYMSVYARIGYRLKNKYFVNLTGRRDGSSRFGSENRFGNFGAVGAAWIFSDEIFVKDKLPFMNFGKIRASFGVTGSDQIGDYSYYSLYEVGSESYQGIKGLQPTSLYNPNYKWEATKKLESAIEFGLFENRVTFEVSWYRNRSSNQLINYPLSVVTGFPSVLTNFNATIENSGWEISMAGDVTNSDSWSWNVSVNFSLPKNKLVEFDGIENSPYATKYQVGRPLSVRSLYRYLGVNNETGRYDFEDKNDDGLINNLDRSLFDLQPRMRYFGGLNNTLRFRALELGFLLQFAHQTQALFLPGLAGKSGINQPSSVLKRWQQPGDQTDVQRFAVISGQGNNSATYTNFVQSNRNVTDASFIRLKTISLTYRLPSSLLSEVHFTDSKIFIQGQNIFTVTSYDGLDPETGNTLPPLRMVTLGAQITL